MDGDEGSEFFYRDETGKKRDAELHAGIMHGADHAAATEIGKQIARQLGINEEGIAELYGNGE